MTNEDFADSLGIAVRTVAKWNANPELVPPTEFQRILDTKLAQASDDEKARFALLVQHDVVGITLPAPRADQDGGAIDLRLAHDPTISDSLRWLENRTGTTEGSAIKRVRAELRTFSLGSIEAQAHRRGCITRNMTAEALRRYYQESLKPGYGFYSAAVGGTSYTTSLVTKKSWLDLSMPLGQGKDILTLNVSKGTAEERLSPRATDAAFHRLAETLTASARVVNNALYRLAGFEVTTEGFC